MGHMPRGTLLVPAAPCTVSTGRRLASDERRRVQTVDGAKARRIQRHLVARRPGPRDTSVVRLRGQRARGDATGGGSGRRGQRVWVDADSGSPHGALEHFSAWCLATLRCQPCPGHSRHEDCSLRSPARERPAPFRTYSRQQHRQRLHRRAVQRGGTSRGEGGREPASHRIRAQPHHEHVLSWPACSRATPTDRSLSR